ncbi:MAG: MATE family efflux transporter [Acidobacteriota bacterium]
MARSPTPSFDRRIVEAPLRGALWRLAWPNIIQNFVASLQGMVDHAMVGHFVGYAGNAAIGVSWQIFLVVVVFVSSLYGGMGVLVARYAGAGNTRRVNRAVYQAFLTSVVLGVGILGPLGYLLTPALLDVVNAAPSVRQEALPYLRVMFIGSIGMLLFFMLGGALRAAGDAKTPMRLGIAMTLLNLTLSVVLIRGLGPIPAFGTTGAALGTVIAGGAVSLYAIYLLFTGRMVVQFDLRREDLMPDFQVIGALFRFGLPTGFQGIVMNIGGVLLLRFIGSLPQSAAAQAAYAVGYNQLFSFVSFVGIGLMGATSAVAGQNLGAQHPERTRATPRAASGLALALSVPIGLLFLLLPTHLLAIFDLTEPAARALGIEFLGYLSVSAIFLVIALSYTGALQGTGDTKSPLYISLVSQLVLPLGLCFAFDRFSTLEAWHIWMAIVLGHVTRALLSVVRFRQEDWRNIEVDGATAADETELDPSTMVP